MGSQLDGVELVAVDHQIPTPIRRHVDEFVVDLDDTEVVQEITQEIVVIARCVKDPGAVAGEVEDASQDLIVDRFPMPDATQTAAVNEIADQIEFGRVVLIQKSKK